MCIVARAEQSRAEQLWSIIVGRTTLYDLAVVLFCFVWFCLSHVPVLYLY